MESRSADPLPAESLQLVFDRERLAHASQCDNSPRIFSNRGNRLLQHNKPGRTTQNHCELNAPDVRARHLLQVHDLWISAKETSRRCPGAKSPALNESEHRIQIGQEQRRGSELSCHALVWRSLGDCAAPKQASLTEHAHYECWNCRKDEMSPRQAPRWSARQV